MFNPAFCGRGVKNANVIAILVGEPDLQNIIFQTPEKKDKIISTNHYKNTFIRIVFLEKKSVHWNR